MRLSMRFYGVPLYVWFWVLISVFTVSLICYWNLRFQQSDDVAIPAPAEVTPLEVIQYIDVLSVDEERKETWFSVHPGPDASGKYHVLIRPFFIVETQLEGADKPVKLLRSTDLIVRLHPGVTVGSPPVPYQKKDLWKIQADLLMDMDQHYEFVQPGWEDFDPATDLR